jgi:hypothetical protein
LFRSLLLLELRCLVLAVSFPTAVRADRSEPVAVDDRISVSGQATSSLHYGISTSLTSIAIVRRPRTPVATQARPTHPPPARATSLQGRRRDKSMPQAGGGGGF